MVALVRFVNLVLAGLLVGNEVGTNVAVHPALERLGTPERIRAEQELTRRYAGIMPFWMTSLVATSLATAALSRKTIAFLPTAAGAACFVGMLAPTLVGNVPINDRVLELSPETEGEEFVELRERWDKLHSLRVALLVVGFALLCIWALRRDNRR